MPSMIVWSCSCGQRDTRARPARAPAPPDAAAIRRTRAATSLPPPRELDARDVRLAHLVDDVVDFAAERVQRGDRAPARRRQEQEAVVEARAALRRLLLAVFVGRHATLRRPSRRRATGPACASATARPVARCAAPGRRAEHVAADGIDARRGCAGRRRSPRRSRGAAARAARAAAAGPLEHARVRAPSRKRISARQRASARACRDLRLVDAEALRGPPAAGRRGPSRQSMATSCQKFVSCSAGADRVARALVGRRVARP